MSLRRFSLAACCAVSLLVAACSSPRVAPQEDAPLGLPGLDELRGTSANAGEFLIRQDGADYAADLLTTGCTVNGTAADFTPNWSANPAGLSDAAIAIYRLTFDPQQPTALALKWATPPQVNTDCWVGLANWTTGTWTLKALTVTSKLTLSNPADYVDSEGRCFVAVILLGSSPCRLSTIGFGEPPPPITGDGYTLIAPLLSKVTYLVDMDGSVAHSWESEFYPGAAVELRPNGRLLRANNLGNPNFNGGGQGGRLSEYDWYGREIWHYERSSPDECLHHDFEVLPDGNILMILWKNVPNIEVRQLGRDPSILNPSEFWVDSIIEVHPTYPSGGEVVWEWDARDHLVQDFDPLLDNYGNPALQPELIDINYPPVLAGDWTHANGIYYNEELDQIALTVRAFSEFWVIDHSTTTAEAASHSGGRYGRGGDLLYRWGNQQAYSQGTEVDQQLFLPHDAHWIADGLGGAGDFLIFNNVAGTPESLFYSTVVQITPPLNPDGSYALTDGVYGPSGLTWEYKAPEPTDFYSGFVSGSQRLPGGNTLICSGQFGYAFEVDPAGSIVWDFQNTVTEGGPSGVSMFRALRYGYDFPGVARLR